MNRIDGKIPRNRRITRYFTEKKRMSAALKVLKEQIENI
jgi:hypothetical protein